MSVLVLVFLAVFACCYGLLSAAGVFTVLVAIGLVPRFAGQTHTANKVLLYEEAVVMGTILGCIISIFEKNCQFNEILNTHFPDYASLWENIGKISQGIFGFFTGMFIGCLALAIAEMLDSIPIFTRRISFRHGIGLAVLSMALGKLCGSLLSFYMNTVN